MRLNAQINDEQFNARKVELETEKRNLQDMLNNIDHSMNGYLESFIKDLNFTQTAKYEFENGLPEKKKEIFAELGSNLSLNFGKLKVEMEKPIELIEKIAPEANRILKRFEPINTPEKSILLETAYSESTIMGQLLDSFLNLKIDFKVNIEPIKILLQQSVTPITLEYN